MATDPVGETAEILGLEASSNGRSSDKHEVNGEVAVVGSFVQFKRTKVTVEKTDEWSIGAHWLDGEGEPLLVGFLRRFLSKRWKRHEGRVAEIGEMCKDSHSSSLRAKSHRCCGVASAEIIAAITKAVIRTPPKKKTRTI